MMVKEPVSFCHFVVPDNSSSGCQHRKEEKRGENFKDRSQKLYIPLSLRTHWPELGHVTIPNYKDDGKCSL